MLAEACGTLVEPPAAVALAAEAASPQEAAALVDRGVAPAAVAAEEWAEVAASAGELAQEPGAATDQELAVGPGLEAGAAEAALEPVEVPAAAALAEALETALELAEEAAPAVPVQVEAEALEAAALEPVEVVAAEDQAVAAPVVALAVEALERAD
jgi:hypothetical protein